MDTDSVRFSDSNVRESYGRQDFIVPLLTNYERRLLGAVAETLLPKTELLMESPTDVGLVERVCRHLALCPRMVQWDFRAVLWGVELASLLRRGSRWSRLPPRKREAALESWRTSGLYLKRLLFRLVEAKIYMAYYSNPQVSQKIGYEPPPSRPRTDLPVHVESAEKDLTLKTDVCVIGSGAGGAVVAKELSEKGREVVLLEEGAYFGARDFGVEANEIVDRIYHNAGTQVTMGVPFIVLPTGRAVGGTTVVNSGTCFRLPDKVLERWGRDFGLTDLTPAALAPYFDRIEKQLHVGPVSEEVLGNNSKIFRRGLEALGRHGSPLLRNVKECRGAGMCCFGCPNDAKQSVNLSYVPEAVRNGTRLIARCRVERIIPRFGPRFGPKGRHGVEVEGRFLEPGTDRPGRSVRIDAKIAVLAAGTLKTPHLLRKNGIQVHNPHVGRHLTIHPTGKIIALFDEEVRGWEGVPQGFSYDGMAEDGIVFEGIFTPPSLIAMSLSLPPEEHKKAMEGYRHLASFGFLISDEGRGGIRWLPNGDPLIYYSIHRRELQRYVKGIRFLIEVFLAAGAKRIFTGLKAMPVVTPETGLEGFDRLKIRRTDLDIAAFHPLGTCRMGSDPSQSVVDGHGRVHGTENLFIADGSIFPSSLGVNPQETIMAFANRTADHIHRLLGST